MIKLEVNDVVDTPLEEIPQEAKEIDIRHLAVGASTVTLCGLERNGLATAHPSKARRTDCLACRDALRKGKAANGALKDAEPVLVEGQYVEYPDGSAWEVLSSNKSGAHIKCVVASETHAKGRTTTIAPTAALRVFSTEEFVALIKRLDAERAAAEVPAAPKGPKPTGKWAPTAADVAEVKRLRLTGLSYIAIETAMGWSIGHGNRPWRICTGKLVAK
jgi:hypothetical protein